jgi:hypothetical protein
MPGVEPCKPKASFSRNVPNKDKIMICNMMGVKVVEAQSKSLGFPIPFGRSKKVVFSLHGLSLEEGERMERKIRIKG